MDSSRNPTALFSLFFLFFIFRTFLKRSVVPFFLFFSFVVPFLGGVRCHFLVVVVRPCHTTLVGNIRTFYTLLSRPRGSHICDQSGVYQANRCAGSKAFFFPQVLDPGALLRLAADAMDGEVGLFGRVNPIGTALPF